MNTLHATTSGERAYCGALSPDLSLDWSPVTCVACRALLAIREIEQDMDDDNVPTTVATFSELHDYVDANEYGGLCDSSLMFPDDGDDAPESFWTMANAVQGEVHRWLVRRAADMGVTQ